MACIIYFLTLAVYFVAASFPEGRVWGLNWWAYFPKWVPAALLIVGVVSGILTILWAVKGKQAESAGDGFKDSNRMFSLLATSISVLMGTMFWLLRGRTHFLGDGYLSLSNLGTGWAGYFSRREIGESLAHIWVKDILGGGSTAALLSYQIISIASGLLFLTILFLGVRALLGRNSDRLILFLGISTGGYILLFFGYVENYSIFVVSVLSFTVTGLLILRGKLNRTVIIPILAISILLHIFGVTLIPATAYLLITDTKLDRNLRRLRPGTRIALISTVGLTAVAAFTYFYTTSYYFRFNIVPLYEDRFVAGGYTILSAKHLIDYSNLIVMLAPSILLLLVGLPKHCFVELKTRSDYQYLFLLTVSTLGAVFIFDPDLGMPRDWDMLSFAGVPLLVSMFYLVLHSAEPSRYSRAICCLAACLNLLVLGPRVVSQVIPKSALSHFYDYTALDKERAIFAHAPLRSYYLELGDTTMANEVRDVWAKMHPERTLLLEAGRARMDGRIQKAISLARDAMDLSPSFVDVYSSLGASYYALRQYDSALSYLEVSNGLRPGSPPTLYHLGNISYFKGNFDKAEQFWTRSFHLDTSKWEPLVGLSTLAMDKRNWKSYQQYLEMAVAKQDSPGLLAKELADLYFKQHRTSHALKLYKNALEKGLAPHVVDELLKAFPQLKE